MACRCGILATLALCALAAQPALAAVAERPLNFENDIIPILSRYGCNASGCHGKAEGQNGFKLSVFGFDPPADYRALTVEGRGRRVFPAAPLGKGWWRCWNAQGVTPALPFVVGELPEVVEQETDGADMPVQVSLPVSINGRIFPREDTDIWTFDAAAGQSLACVVVARDLGSPLAAKLALYDPAGKLLAESTGSAASEARIEFVAAASGRYALHITDVAAGGLQHYVYRLTVADSQPPTPAADRLERRETESNETAASALAVTPPALLSGCIQTAGDVDCWQVELAKGQPMTLSSDGSRLGSPLALLLAIKDGSGRQLAQLDGSTSVAPSLSFTPPADGKYLVEVRERFARRGGPDFAYRILVAASAPDFRLFVPDSVSVDIGTEKKLDVTIERSGDMLAPVTLHVEGLPTGVTCDAVVVPPKANKAALVFNCARDAPVVSTLLSIVGRSEINGRRAERAALLAGQKDGFARGAAIPTRLATTLATPFKFSGQFSLIYTPRGGVLRKRYAIDRGGFVGPLEARLADRQGRHLQGVTGGVVSIAPEAIEFEYPLTLPPWMELGRTSRTNLMLTGEVPDASGTPHKVCFTTKEQNEQLIALVTASALRLSLERSAVAIEPNSELTIPVAILRDASVTSPVKMELIVPRHMRDVSAAVVESPASAASAALVVRLGPAPGPLNMPLTIRATGQRQGDPITAEEPLELIRTGP